MKKIILAFALFLLALPLVNADQLNPSEGNLTIWIPFDDPNTKAMDNKTRTDLMQINLSESGSPLHQQTALVNYSSYSQDFDGTNDYFFNKSVNDHIGFGGENGITIAVWIQADAPTTSQDVYTTRSGTKGLFLRLVDGGADDRWTCAFNNGDVEIVSDFGANSNPNYGFFVCVFNSTTVAIYRNGTKGTTAAITPSASDKGTNFSVGFDWFAGSRFFNGRLDELSVWNRSLGELEIRHLMTYGPNATSSDSTPLDITYYNLTVGNGCESWNTDKTIACNTSLERPTIQFNTSKNAYCAISANASSTPGINYTEMGSSRQCTGAVSGEGTKEHYCTLALQDELVYETSYLYISCKDGSNHTNKSGESTSGPLKLNVTNLESDGRSSIELGISNSLSNSYTIYTGQKIYARNSANTQQLGTFDKVVKKLSRIWAFNRIGIFDSHANMLNITPVLYTLELSNRTSSNITLEVELLINSTK